MKQKIGRFSFYFLLPVFLFVLGIGNLFGYLKASEFGISQLDVKADINNLVSTRSGEMLKGDIIYGNFHSKFTNLGIVSVRFFNENRDSDDVLIFRLKEEGAPKWYYEAKYKTDQFLPHKHFPFGFPVISQSNEKNYEFEIESTRGATGSGIVVDFQKPVFVAKSIFTKEYLEGDMKQLAYFLSNKIVNIFGEEETRLNTFIYFMPLILYFLYLLFFGTSYHYLTSLAIILTIWDITYLTQSYDYVYLSVLFLWALISRRFRFEARIAAAFAFAYLAVTPLLIIFGEDSLAEKTAIWAYLFLCVTVAQQIYELKRKKLKVFTLNQFVGNIRKVEVPENAPIRKVSILYIPISIIFLIVLITESIEKILSTYNIYAGFYPSDKTTMFIKGTFIAFALSFGALLLIAYLTRNSKSIWSRTVLIFISGYLLINYSMSRSIPFARNVKILSITPDEISEAWVDVSINGKNFNNLPFGGKVVIDHLEQKIIHWSDERIIFRTNPETTKTGSVRVITHENVVSNPIEFKYEFKY